MHCASVHTTLRMQQPLLSLTLALATLLTAQAQTSEYDPYAGFKWRLGP